MLTLQELLEDARRGYIADSEKIAEILEKVANMPWGVVLDSIADKEAKYDAKLFVQAACEMHGINEDDRAVRSLSYAEVASLLEHLKCMHEEFRALMDFMFSALQKSRKQNFVLEQFFMIGVEELFQYLKTKKLSEAVKHHSDCSNMGNNYNTYRRMQEEANHHQDDLYTGKDYDRYRKMMEEDNLTDNIDIGTALHKIKSCRRVAWNPNHDLNNYKRRVEEVYEVWDILLIRSFLAVYPEKFLLKDVLNKLQRSNV